MSDKAMKETNGAMHLRHKLELGKEIESLRSELQKQKELNAELVKGLIYIKKLLGPLCMAQDTPEGESYYTAESLIKKSKS